jgi:two-component system, NarL family, invasion response regulator UvrY
VKDKDHIPSKFRIFLLDADPTARQCLGRLIAFEKDLIVCGEASALESAIKELRACRADLAVVDPDAWTGEGTHTLGQLRREHPSLPLIIVSLRDVAVFGRQVLNAGAAGFISKTDAAREIIRAIRRVAQGGVYIPAGGRRKS